MATFNDLTTGIQMRLQTAFNSGTYWTPNQDSLKAVDVLVADAADIEDKIDIAVDKIGMLMLINMPGFTNEDLLADVINAKIRFIIEVGEDALSWRDTPLTKPTGKDLAQIVARLIQGFIIDGFEPLRVLSGDFHRDKKRQVYFVEVETMQIFDAS